MSPRSRKTSPEQDFDAESDSIESVNCCQLTVHKKKILEQKATYHEHPVKSPLKGRSCTDVICLLIFIVFLVAWAVLGYFAFRNGSPEELFAPLDSQNQRCGFDEAVKDRPVLFFFDLSQCLPHDGQLFHCTTPQQCAETIPRYRTYYRSCTHQVCQDKCPEDNFHFDYYYTTMAMAINYTFVRDQMICKDDFDKIANITSMEEAKKAVDAYQCAKWYVKSFPVAQRCLPNPFTGNPGDILNISLPVPPGSGSSGFYPVDSMTVGKLTDSSFVIQALSTVNEFGQAVVKDLTETWPWIIACIGLAMVVSLLWIIIMRWIAGLMVWFSLLACVAILSYCSYATWIKYEELRDAVPPDTPDQSKPALVRDPILDAINSQWESYLRMKETWLAFFIISVSVLATILLIILFLRSRIRLAVSLINEGSKAVSHSWTALAFPIFPWIVQIGVICYSVAICLYLFSSGAPIYRVNGLSVDSNCTCCTLGYQEHSLCLPEQFDGCCHNHQNQTCAIASCLLDKTESETYGVYLQLYNLFMFLWALFFVSAFGQLVLASSFATYYWTFNKNDIPLFTVATSSLRVLRYHLGTAAFGAFLLALCNWIRIMIEVAYNYFNKYDNTFVKAIKCCLSCFFWCLDKFLRFLNKNAYIMCAIHGKNFCWSAKEAFSLLLRNIVRVFVLDKVTDFLFFISKLTIVAGMGAISFYLFSNPVDTLNDSGVPYQARYYFIPIIFVCIGTFFITSLFFSVYSMAVDTMFLCFLEDCEKNDGSAEKPYFMSKNLMRILGRKNKPPKQPKKKN